MAKPGIFIWFAVFLILLYNVLASEIEATSTAEAISAGRSDICHRFNYSMGKIDPDSEEVYWEKIRWEKKFLELVLRAPENSVNEPPKGRYLKVVAISDTHDQLRQQLAKIPNGDVLIHAGDFSNAGDHDMIVEFNDVMGMLPHKHKLVVAGNHELGFDDTEDWDKRDCDWIGRGTRKGYELLTNATWLHDKEYIVDGVKFYGSSWHPLRGYPFYTVRGEAMEKVWSKIPHDTNVLITHTPALGYLDTFGDERWGCRALLEKIEEVKPAFHVFGHVHECYGAASNGNTTFVNAAQCLKNNTLHNDPIVFYVPLP